MGWELYWCVCVTTAAIVGFSLRAWYHYKTLREKNEIIMWNVQERIALEKVIEENNDYITSLREKVRYYKGLANKNKNYRKP